MKMAIRFEILGAIYDMPSDVSEGTPTERIISLFRQALRQTPCLLSADHLSLASTNQKYGFIAGIDYLFVDLIELSLQSLQDRLNWISALNKKLAGKLSVSQLVSIHDLATPSINKYAYYVADLSQMQMPPDFANNLTYIMTRDTDAAGESISVTELTYRMKGNRQKTVPKTYSIIELVPHLHYIPEKKKLYFIADGNAPAFILLAGLLYGKCTYSNELMINLKLSRLDYLDGRQKILHNNRHYDNILGDYISLE